MKLALLAAAFMVTASVGACINDRDTLAFELRNVDAIKRVRQETDYKKKGDAAHEIALKAIGGRFERFPAKYYEMRIARLKALPTLTALEYDDLAVAYERIGKTDKAIDILLASKPHRKTKDDAYRFHANYGTFLVHKWLAQKDRADKKALKQSISEIEKALKINPYSHFGRELVQLELEKMWLTDGTFDTWSKIDQLVGMSGIVMMGLAYELPDAYVLMTKLRVGAAISQLDGFAISRANELITNGHGLVSEDLFHTHHLDQKLKEETRKAFVELRMDGENVHQARLAYVEQRLNRGEHPDTNPNFWKEWQEPPFPVLKIISNPRSVAANKGPSILFGVAAGAIVTALGLFIWKRRAKRARLVS